MTKAQQKRQLIQLIAKAQVLARKLDDRDVYVYLDLAKINATPLIDLRNRDIEKITKPRKSK